MISVCIITKNEQDNLEECLSRLMPYDFEIVVVDTGSTDDSKNIALKYTNNVYDFQWINDFSAARNFAITKATNEFILMLDTDEFITDLDIDTLLKLVSSNPLAIGRIHRKSPFQNGESPLYCNELINRLFSKEIYYYTGSIHEQLTPIANNKKGITTVTNTYVVPVFTDHHGYFNKETLQAKAIRNLDLLKKELEHNPSDTYILYQIGKSYHSLEDYENAIIYFERLLNESFNPKLEYIINMISLYGYSLINANHYEAALRLEQYFDEFCTSADYMFILGLIYMQNARFQDSVMAFLCATDIKDCNVEGVNSYMAFYNIGVIYECVNDLENAKLYYKKAGNYEPALEGLKRCS